MHISPHLHFSKHLHVTGVHRSSPEIEVYIGRIAMCSVYFLFIALSLITIEPF
ncbi:hypothetical protein HanXRQr2_Chr11g0489781 [Helianthus annuus]|uniref:Uncharacterized protein n=1 Tax=Helianthus annuus TaxID=4232 RepID=A0A251TCG2_HELAN|nr:hypothetical protein HanXRQr2_Chr11g0489781 [Helianthus annuus]KAJ0509292.1 hypothetical protein HanIR_Chr11g0527231 [Helianthus annuus]KAJ0875088.1 hypothetical protein HanPSC8_Chr11g0472081 [Helianthus annuus]